jgi:phage tail sheath gpL-like
MPSIPLTGLSSNDVVPGSYIQINFAAGQAAGSGSTYSILLMGNKLSAGSATADTVVYGPDTATALTSLQDAVDLFGVGSELYRMYKRVTAVNASTSVYAIAVAESAGAQATGTITVVGTATANATLRIFVGDDFVDTSIVTGDNVTTQAANAVININGRSDLPVSATASLGVITLTAKQKGLRGNSIKISGQMLPTSSGVTVSPTASTALTSGGAADVFTNALATILPRRFYYIVPACDDSTNLGLVQAQVASQAAPITGIRQRVLSGSTASLSAAGAIAAVINNPRVEVACLPSGDVTPAEVAAQFAAAVSLEEASTVPTLNFDSYGNDPSSRPYWRLTAPRNITPPTRVQVLAALNSGVTPIGTNANGSTYIVKRVTSYINSTSTPDYRIRDSHKVTICDLFADAAQAKIALQLAGKQVGDDPQRGQQTPGPNVVTPRVLKALLSKLVFEFAANDLVQNPDVVVANMAVQRETTPRTRLTSRIPLQTADILDQIGTVVDQIA